MATTQEVTETDARFERGLATRRAVLGNGMITALGRMHELRLRIRGAVNNGLSDEEIREVFLQAAVYCGLPAAVDGFRVVQEVQKEMGKIP